ncbi:MAG: helix-turn-helix domain-containing protein [Gordonia amarae]
MATRTPRDQLIAGAADLLARRGLRATSVREVAKHSGAPLGSTYHYFPGGKSQLAVEAVGDTSAFISRVLARELAASGPVDGFRSFLDMWRKIVTDSDFRAGCPVLAVAVEEPDDDDDAPLNAASAAFDDWVRILAGSLIEHGAGETTARQTATLVVASVEGTVAICRAQRSTAALDDIDAVLTPLLRRAIGTTGRPAHF